MHAITMAKKSGANAVKIQTYTPDTMIFRHQNRISKSLKAYGKAIRCMIYIPRLIRHSNGMQHYCHAKQEEITLFSILMKQQLIFQDLDAPAYKIASSS